MVFFEGNYPFNGVFCSCNLHYEKFQDGTVKCIEDEIPFEVPEGWEWVRVASIVQICLGLTHTPDYVNRGIPFYSVKDISSGGLDTSNPKYISEEEFDNFPSGAKPQKGDILFGRVGTLGKPTVVEIEEPFGIFVSLGFFRKIYEHFSSEYIMSWMDSSLFWDQVSVNVKGAVLTNLNTGWLSRFLIPIPPMKEQFRIADYVKILLTKTDSISATKEELFDLITATKSKILDLAIRGKLVPQDPNDEPASVLLEHIRAEKEELIKQGKIKRDKKESTIFRGDDNSYYETIDGQTECVDDDIPFDLPDNWQWAHLFDIVQVLNGDRGQNYPAKNKLQKTGIPFVSASNIDSGIVSSNDLLCMTEEQYNALGAGKLILGDIVYCIRGSLGKCGMFTLEKGAIASSLVIVRPIVDGPIVSQYIFNYLNSELSKSEITKYDNGSAQPNLAAKDFMKFLVPVPPANEQHLINNKLEKIYSQILPIEKELQ